MSYPDTLTRSDEAKTKAETIIETIPVMTRLACGFRNIIFSTGEYDGKDYDVRVLAKVGRANRLIEIVLELNDTYTVRFLKVPTARAKDRTPVALEEADDVYCDMLGEVVYHMVNK